MSSDASNESAIIPSYLALVLKLFEPYGALLVTSCCTLHRKLYSLCALAHGFYVSRKGGTGGSGWVTRRCCTHGSARLGCKRIMAGTRWANFHPGCINRLRKCYSHLVGGSFLAEKAAWALSGFLPSENTDYCTLVIEWAWLRSRDCLSKAENPLEFSFGVRVQTEMIKGREKLIPNIVIFLS